MSDFFSFVLNHWALSALFVLTLVLLLIYELQQHAQGIPNLSPQEAVGWINHQKAKVVDVRSADLFKAGHIVGAHNWSMDELVARSAKQKNKKQALVVVCNRGQQAIKASATLRQQGFENVAILSGGMQAWAGDNLPVVQ